MTFARRGTPRTDAVEAITHNAKGEMVDYYNHWLWTPLCEAISALDYAADAGELHPLTIAKATQRGATEALDHAPLAEPPAPGSLPKGLPETRKYLKSGWRRRELNPSALPSRSMPARAARGTHGGSAAALRALASSALLVLALWDVARGSALAAGLHVRPIGVPEVSFFFGSLCFVHARFHTSRVPNQARAAAE